MDGDAGPQVAAVHHESYPYNSNHGSSCLPYYQFQFLSNNKGFHETTIQGISSTTKKKQKNQSVQDHYPRNGYDLVDEAQASTDLYTAQSISATRGAWEGFSFMKHSASTETHDGIADVWKIGLEEAKSKVENFASDNQYDKETSDRVIKPIALRINSEIATGDGADSDSEFPSSDQQRLKKGTIFKNSIIDLDMNNTNSEYADDQSLSLKLWSTSSNRPQCDAYNTGNGARNSNVNKRYRPSSPTSGINNNNNNNNCNSNSNSNSNTQQTHVCQVDDCHVDLKHAKDYHRRHRVCELHSKSPQSLVQRTMQRFCQQCSRFHPLQEFDEGKRSCRRRLAGHNKRRRKSNIDVNGANGLNIPVGSADTIAQPGNADLLSIITLLSQFQAAKAKEKPDPVLPSPEQEALVQSLKNAAMVRDATLAAYQNLQNNMAPICGVMPQRQDQVISQSLLTQLGHLSQEAVVIALRNILGSQAILPAQESIKIEKKNIPSPNFINVQAQPPSSNEQSIHSLSSGGQSSPEEHLRKRSINENVNDFTLSSQSRKIFNVSSTESEVEPGSSPESNYTRSPTEQKFFPTETCSNINMLRDSEANIMKTNGGDTESHLIIQGEMPVFRQHYTTGDRPIGKTSIRRISDSSESGSDQSPASSSSNSQELTGRIIFKLCDVTRIADIPQNYKSQLQEWLSVTPCFMEEYMRPGCILLTVFLSMPHWSWKELTLDLRESLKRLLQLSHASLWNKGRILVQVEQKKALIINGEVKRISYSRDDIGPIIRSVRPLAVEAGEEATLIVHGYNLVPETKIVCAYHGMYVLHEVAFSTSENRDEQRIQFPGGPSNVLGRCFVEVEHNLLGNILPVIVADKEICAELRSLEKELDLASSCQSSDMDGFLSDEIKVNKEAEAINFLQELGWIFQSTAMGISPACSIVDLRMPHMELYRFKGLLKYAVLHDWCAVVKKLLDLLFGIGVNEIDEVLSLVSELNLVHKAVKRKSKAMVELLMHYAPDGYGSKSANIFTPIMKGPAGFTPLHVAASMSGAEDVLEALIDDPYEVGLYGWRSAYDFEGLTPEWHARNKGNVSYLNMLERKIQHKKSPFVSITIQEQNSKNNISISRGVVNDEDPAVIIELPKVAKDIRKPNPPCRSCRAFVKQSSSCSVVHMRTHRPLLMMMVAVAALCATVAVFFKTPPHLESVFYSLKWEGINYGPS